MGHYKKYSGGNHHLRMDMDHERRLIHDAKDAIWDEDAKLRDRKSAAHYTKEEEDLSLEGGTMPVDDRAVAKEKTHTTNMKDFAIGSDERRAEYDRRGWAHDETTERSTMGTIREGAKNLLEGVTNTIKSMPLGRLGTYGIPLKTLTKNKK